MDFYNYPLRLQVQVTVRDFIKRLDPFSICGCLGYYTYCKTYYKRG